MTVPSHDLCLDMRAGFHTGRVDRWGAGFFEIRARPANAARVAFGVLLVRSTATSTRFRPSAAILAPAAARSPVSSRG